MTQKSTSTKSKVKLCIPGIMILRERTCSKLSNLMNSEFFSSVFYVEEKEYTKIRAMPTGIYSEPEGFKDP